MLRKIPVHIRFLFLHYILGIIFFLAFRLILFLGQIDLSSIQDNELNFVKHAFKIGFQFDSVIMGYILFVPLIVLSISTFFKSWIRFLKIINYFILTLIFIAFFISSADIPYFDYNFARISAVIFEWVSDTGIIISMIIEEPSYIAYTLVFIAFFGSYLFFSRKIIKRLSNEPPSPNTKKNIGLNIAVSLVAAFFIFLSMRGRIDSPIRINHAFFCNNSFYNQLGLNPTFTLLKSLKQSSSIKVIDDKVALENVKHFLGSENNLYPDYPIARKEKQDSLNLNTNIVLVMMESMSANKLSQFGNPKQLTPFLDSLSAQSLNFKNIYSAGRHTCDGIFASLYSYPAVLRERPMSAVKINHFSGIPEVLKKLNYTNIYFTSHSETFDNVGVFLPLNDFDRIYSQKDYDPSLVNNSFGVPDHVLFDYAIAEMDEMHSKNQKFFSSIMTISDHGPYVIPKNISFSPQSDNIKEQIVEYCDWSIQQFIEKAKQKDWFDNTVFVFVADHGVVNKNSIYEIPLSLHHIPFLIYSANSQLISPQDILKFGNQTDVLPTLAGLLNFNYTNNTFGVDLLKEDRPYSYFSSDDKLGCINEKYYYIYRTNGNESLHLYKEKDANNIISSHPKIAKEMKNYVVSMTQASKWLISNHKTSLREVQK